MEPSLSRNWWVLALRGVFAIAFGVLVFFWPHMDWAVIVALFAGYAFLDGVLALWAAASAQASGRSWTALAFEGAASATIGWLTLVWPKVTGPVLLFFIAFRAMLTGAFEVATAAWFGRRGAAALALAGLLSVLFGMAAMFVPGAGALTVAWLIAVYALVFGALQFAVAIRLGTAQDVATAGTTRPRVSPSR
jgi:uncharacterized membrane protein HdeD (DUF308 family)